MCVCDGGGCYNANKVQWNLMTGQFVNNKHKWHGDSDVADDFIGIVSPCASSTIVWQWIFVMLSLSHRHIWCATTTRAHWRWRRWWWWCNEIRVVSFSLRILCTHFPMQLIKFHSNFSSQIKAHALNNASNSNPHIFFSLCCRAPKMEIVTDSFDLIALSKRKHKLKKWKEKQQNEKLIRIFDHGWHFISIALLLVLSLLRRPM